MRLEIYTWKNHKKAGWGIIVAAQDIELDIKIVLDFFLFDPGRTDAVSEGGCAAIMDSRPTSTVGPIPHVAEVSYAIGIEVKSLLAS